MVTPTGLVQIKALYGDPAGFIRDDGTVSPLWDARMVKVPFPGPLPLGWDKDVSVKTARVNQAIADEVTNVFEALRSCGAWDHVLTFDGAYTWRSQRGARKLSMHAFGGAIDLNASTNELGTIGDMDPTIVDIFTSHGWEWGGFWKRPDPMHFQFARNY